MKESHRVGADATPADETDRFAAAWVAEFGGPK
jgi:hypothetical protein